MTRLAFRGSAARAFLLACSLALPTLPALAWSQDPAADPVAHAAEVAMWWGDFDAVERLYADAAGQRGLDTRFGRSGRQSVRTGLSEVFKYDDLNGAYFRELEMLSERWAAERPGSVLAQLVYARALYARAWHLRGSGYWQTVPEPAKAEFTRLIGKAERHLTERAPMLMQDSTTHIYLLMIGRSAGWSEVQLDAVAEDGAARVPADREDIYAALIPSKLPKWGGDLTKVERLTNDVDRRMGDADGHELYARLWSVVVGDLDGNVFKQTRADWRRIKAGFERLSAKFSDTFYVNRLGFFACQAEDRLTLRATLARMGVDNDLRGWGGGGAGRQQHFEACQRWAALER